MLGFFVKRMRLKLIDSIFLLYLFVFITITFIGLSIYVFSDQYTMHEKLHSKENNKDSIKQINGLVTVIMREFELFENDVALTVHSFKNIFPKMPILILYDELPYPPLDITMPNNSLPNVRFVKLVPNLKTSFMESYPLNQIKTKYVLFIPDSTRTTSQQSLQIMISDLVKKPGGILAASVRSQRNVATCLMLDINIREWTLRYSKTNRKIDCDGILGKHLLLIELATLKKLPNSFLLPFPQSLYIQTASLGLKVIHF